MSDENYDDDFKSVAALTRSITAEDQVRHKPPPDIWAGIAAGVAEPTVDVRDEQVAPVINLTDRSANTTGPNEQRFNNGHVAEPSSPRWSPRLMLVAAAVVFSLIVGSTIAFVGGNSNAVYAAEISNADLPEAFDGIANVTVEFDDNPMIVIDFDGDIPTDEPVELWIINADATDIVPVGVVEPGDTTWEWPHGFDPAEYPLVDLSIEPNDGDPTHSGRSILRGELITT